MLTSTFIPRKYQWAGAYFLARREGALLGDEVGLGKTATAILACIEIKAGAVLLIVPLRHKAFWVQEIIKVEQAMSRMPITITTEETVYGPLVRVGAHRVYTLAHYEQFRDGKMLDAQHRPIPTWQAEAYLKVHWDAVIIDEAHRIKNRKAQRTRWIKKLRTGH